MIDWLIRFLIYGLFIPASWLCFIPVRKYLKWNLPFSRFLIYTTAGLTFIVLLLCQMQTRNVEQTHFVFYVVLALCGGFYWNSFTIQKSVLVYMFSFVLCVVSCATLLSYYWDAMRHPTSNYTVSSIESGLSQWIAIGILSIIFIFLFGKRLEWMIDHYHENKVWLYMSTPSWIISMCMIIMVPHEYANLYIGRLFSVSVHAAVTLIFLFILTHMIFYALARSTYERAEMENANRMMELQLHQIDMQNSYITETHRIRHDFKHSVLAISTLLQEDKIQEAKDYLNNYYSLLDSEQQYIEFCSLPALNALLNEYLRQAKESSISFHHRIYLPKNVGIEEPKLCILFGNLLNNAIHACTRIPEEKRFIKLLVDTEGDRQLYLMIQNSYDGKQKWTEEQPDLLAYGHYGVYSIRSIAEEYNGVARFFSEDDNFRVEVMLNIKIL